LTKYITLFSSLKRYRVLRTWLFVCLGLSGILPLLHNFSLHSLQDFLSSSSLEYTAAMGASYLIGALLYASQVPESFLPGKFDLFFNSHQIFHFCVLLSAILHYIGLVQSYQWHISSPCNVS